MAKVVAKRNGGAGDHSCLSELPNQSTADYDGDMSKWRQPAGTVVRCSCGKLWKTRYAYIDHMYTKWKPAKLWLKYKYKNDGWDEKKIMETEF